VLLAGRVESLFVVEARKAILACLFGVGIAALDLARAPGWFRPGALVGRAGYSLYAFHAPLLVLTPTLGAPWWLAGATTIAGSLANLCAVRKAPHRSREETRPESRNARIAGVTAANVGLRSGRIGFRPG
jgi:peptidoglycan/LPS O-acetylase OafA/YrhL